MIKIQELIDKHLKMVVTSLVLSIILSLYLLYWLLGGLLPPPPINTTPSAAAIRITETLTSSSTPPSTPTPTPQGMATPTPMPQGTAMLSQVPQSTETSLPTPQSTAIPVPSPTKEPTQIVKNPRYKEICLSDIQQVHITGTITKAITEQVTLKDFPPFTQWCPNKIQQFYIMNKETDAIEIDTPDFDEEPIGTVFLMATVHTSVITLPTTWRVDNTTNPPNQKRYVAKITYIYNDSKNYNSSLKRESYDYIIVGENISDWDYHTPASLHVNEPQTYRIWSGLNNDKTHVSQILVLLLKPTKKNIPDTYQLTKIKIEYLENYYRYELDLYGIIFSNLTSDQIAKQVQQKRRNENLKPLCIDNTTKNSDSVFVEYQDSPEDEIKYSRKIKYAAAVDVDREFYEVIKDDKNKTKCIDSSSVSLYGGIPDELIDYNLDNLPDSTPLGLGFIFGPEIYETRPPQEGITKMYSSTPTLTIILTETKKIHTIYLTLSARNLCYPQNDQIKDRNLGSIEVYPRLASGELESSIKTIKLVVGENIQQGRSGIEGCSSFIGSTGLPLDARLLGGSQQLGIPLASKKTIETNDQPVALWVNVISIPIPENYANKSLTIKLTDNTIPEPSSPSGNPQTVDFKDPYLVLYGVTVETADQ